MYQMHGGVVTPVYAIDPVATHAGAAPTIPQHLADASDALRREGHIPSATEMLHLQRDAVLEMRRAYAEHATHTHVSCAEEDRRVAADVLEWIADAVRSVHPCVRMQVLLRLMGAVYAHVDYGTLRLALLAAQIDTDLDFGCGWGTREPRPRVAPGTLPWPTVRLPAPVATLPPAASASSASAHLSVLQELNASAPPFTSAAAAAAVTPGTATFATATTTPQSPAPPASQQGQTPSRPPLRAGRRSSAKSAGESARDGTQWRAAPRAK